MIAEGNALGTLRRTEQPDPERVALLSIPHVFFVELYSVLFQKLSQFMFKTFLFVLLFLPCNVFLQGRHIRFAN